jgi:hypothetical protein
MSLQLRNGATQRFDYLCGVGSGGVSDIDSAMERHGRFLILENKWPGEEIPLGQLILLRRLQALPQFEVWVVRGQPPDSIVSFGPLDGEQIPAGVEDVRKAAQEWWDKE